MTEPIDKVAFVHVRDGAILITRSHGKDAYYIPGGKREAGESDQDTLIREILEELQVAINPATIERLGEFTAQAHGKPEGVLVTMKCYDGEFDGTPIAANEIAEVTWFTYADRHRVSPVDQLIFDDLHAQGLLASIPDSRADANAREAEPGVNST